MLSGCAVGFIAFVIIVIADQLTDLKWAASDPFWHRAEYAVSWAVLSAIIGLYVLPAILLTLRSPLAAGSGIDHVKAYLNGNHKQGVLELRTLTAKVVGIACCVSAGLPVGRKGPMVHSGAIAAWFVAKAISLFQHSSVGDVGLGFDNDFDRRNLVTMGAAAGVAASFKAPIGGIVFAFEDVSSFWDSKLTLYSFICASIATFSVDLLLRLYEAVGGEYTTSIVIWRSSVEYGSRCAEDSDVEVYELWELLVFVVLGLMCGLLGAFFNFSHMQLQRLRQRLYAGRSESIRGAEALIVVWLVMSVLFWLPVMLPQCRGPFDLSSAEGLHVKTHPVCETAEWLAPASGRSGSGSGSNGRRGAISELATLLSQSQEEAMKLLFSHGTHGLFSIPTLLIFATTYFLAMLLVCGLLLPSGMFVPGMIVGAAIGRIVGELLSTIPGLSIDPGRYALIGAAGMLGGITRMMISLTIILVELTEDVRLLVPMMLAILSAKLIGDRFTLSLYDMAIALQGYVMLDEGKLPEVLYLAPVRMIMTSKLLSLREVELATFIEKVLATRAHSSFPVVDMVCEGSSVRRYLIGVVTRTKLEAAVNEAKATDRKENEGMNSFVSTLHPTLRASLTEERAVTSKKINVRSLCDPSPYVVNELMPLYRVNRFFQMLGLRSLYIVDTRHTVVGVITRADLTKADEMLAERVSQKTQKVFRTTQSHLRMLEAVYSVSHFKATGHSKRVGGLYMSGQSFRTDLSKSQGIEHRVHRRRHSDPGSTAFVSQELHVTRQTNRMSRNSNARRRGNLGSYSIIDKALGLGDGSVTMNDGSMKRTSSESFFRGRQRSVNSPSWVEGSVLNNSPPKNRWQAALRGLTDHDVVGSESNDGDSFQRARQRRGSFLKVEEPVDLGKFNHMDANGDVMMDRVTMTTVLDPVCSMQHPGRGGAEGSSFCRSRSPKPTRPPPTSAVIVPRPMSSISKVRDITSDDATQTHSSTASNGANIVLNGANGATNGVRSGLASGGAVAIQMRDDANGSTHGNMNSASAHCQTAHRRPPAKHKLALEVPSAAPPNASHVSTDSTRSHDLGNVISERVGHVLSNIMHFTSGGSDDRNEPDRLASLQA